jgi:hypothetical protein
MGKVGEDTTCVDPEFRVVGLNNLRVADMSVCPVVPRQVPDETLNQTLDWATQANCHVCSNHTQSTAYLVGEVAADKLIKEYNL